MALSVRNVVYTAGLDMAELIAVEADGLGVERVRVQRPFGRSLLPVRDKPAWRL
jgi:hypothetical protein